MYRRMNHKHWCPKCYKSQWVTIVEGKLYRCVNCDYVGLGVPKPQYIEDVKREKMKRRIMAARYYRMLREGIRKEVAKSELCKEYNISRSTFHRQLYRAYIEREEDLKRNGDKSQNSSEQSSTNLDMK